MVWFARCYLRLWFAGFCCRRFGLSVCGLAFVVSGAGFVAAGLFFAVLVFWAAGGFIATLRAGFCAAFVADGLWRAGLLATGIILLSRLRRWIRLLSLRLSPPILPASLRRVPPRLPPMPGHCRVLSRQSERPMAV